MACIGIWFGIFNTCGGVGLNRETDDEHCVEEGFQLARVQFDRDSEGDRYDKW